MGAAPNRGSLFRVDADGSAHADGQRASPSRTASGFSPDDTRLYFTDTGRRTIYVYDFDLARGEIAHRRPFVELARGAGPPGRTDGRRRGFRLGRGLGRLDDPAVRSRGPRCAAGSGTRARPTSCCFGGADLRTLYVTSASVRLPEQALADAPLSGALFACTPGVAGLRETPFAG